MKVSWFTPSKSLDYNKNLASVWIRCLQIIPEFKKLGIESALNVEEENSNVAIFVRMQDPKAYEIAKRLRGQGKKIVFDLCVNYLETSGEAGPGFGSFKHQRDEALKMIELADLVTCASNNIAQAATKYHQNVHYLSDSINFDHFRHKKELTDFDKKNLNISYGGVACKTNYFFEHIYPEAQRIGYKTTMIMDKRRPIFKRYKFKKWRYENFPLDIVNADIGIAPRDVETTYDKGHSIFKIGVFLAQGIPVLASPVPSYDEVLKDNKCGMICHTPRDWKNALEKINDDRNILKSWSQEARDLVSSYGTGVIAKKFSDLIKNL